MPKQFLLALSAFAALWSALSDARAEERFLITANGLGGFDRDTIVRIDDLRAAYPEFRIATELFQAEGDTYSRIVGFEGDARAFELQMSHGRFYEIKLYSPRFSDVFGVSPGAPYADAPIDGVDSCFQGGEGSIFVLCPAAPVNAPQLQYMFLSKGQGAPLSEQKIHGIRLY